MPPQRRIYLLQSDPAWAGVAERLAAEVAGIMGPLLIHMEHIGSTAIPGIHAKPIIDLMPVVASIDGAEPLQEPFEAAGFEWLGERGLPGRRFLRRDDPATGERQVNVHIYAEGNPEIKRHVAFRDYLRAHPDVAREYEAVKLDCAMRNSTDISGYIDCKDATCKQLESAAVAWCRVVSRCRAKLH